jgi:hypothetical protein
VFLGDTDEREIGSVSTVSIVRSCTNSLLRIISEYTNYLIAATLHEYRKYSGSKRPPLIGIVSTLTNYGAVPVS